jgi:hypothetical protein
MGYARLCLLLAFIISAAAQQASPMGELNAKALEFWHRWVNATGKDQPQDLKIPLSSPPQMQFNMVCTD